MNDDIVARLGAAADHPQDSGGFPTVLILEAKREIEKLRSTIEQLRRVAGAASLDGGLVDIKADIAKKKENPSHG